MSKKKTEILTPHLALFNCHINKAEKRAIKLFKESFDEDTFEKEIQPFLDKGIMSIMQKKPNQFTSMFVGFITAFANEKSL